MNGVRLVVQGDDFGMAHAVNTGTVEAFLQGILTQVTVMAPAPWFDEAVALVRQHDIPAGMHSTLTCDWDRLRWRPLTPGPSLVGDDGVFHSTVRAAAEAVDIDEATTELIAQAERLLANGIEFTHVDTHMGRVCVPAYEAVCERFGRRFLHRGVEPNIGFDTWKQITEVEPPERKGFLLEWLETREPGVHLLWCHPATASEELRSMASPECRVYRWTEELRVPDLEVLTDDEVIKKVHDLGIELVSTRDL